MLHLSEWSRTLALMSTDTRGFWFTWRYVSQDVRKLWPQDDLSLTQSICPVNAATLHLSDRSKTLAFMRTDAHFYGSHTDIDSVCFAADMQHMTITTPPLWHSQYALWMSSRCNCQIRLKRSHSWEHMYIFIQRHWFDMFCSIHATYDYHNAPGLTQLICPINAITLHSSDWSETPALVRTDVHFYVLYTQVTCMCLVHVGLTPATPWS